MPLLTRRDFLRLTSISLLGLAFKPLPPEDQAQPIFYGRVIVIYITVYSRPSAFGRTVKLYERETILPIYGEVMGEDDGAYNRLWYRTTGGYVHSSNVQPVKIRTNAPSIITSPALGEITLPYADSYPQPRYSSTVAYRLYYSTTHWVNRSMVDDSGHTWYELTDDRINDRYYVPAAALRLITASELAPLSPSITDKLIHIDTTAETLSALENGIVVFNARISSGITFTDSNTGQLKDFRTPLGRYAIYRKRPSRHMAAGDGVADDSYDLPGVPWVSYFNGGMAIHGTYWHNDYGRAWSHGCINARPEDAKWIYRWSLPLAPADRPLVESTGAPVVIE